jgi:hypothetical protein
MISFTAKKTKTPSPSKTKHYKKESTKESSGNESNTCINTIGRTSRTNQQNKTNASAYAKTN